MGIDDGQHGDRAHALNFRLETRLSGRVMRMRTPVSQQSLKHPAPLRADGDAGAASCALDNILSPGPNNEEEDGVTKASFQNKTETFSCRYYEKAQNQYVIIFTKIGDFESVLFY
jgi:hypothetical protein